MLINQYIEKKNGFIKKNEHDFDLRTRRVKTNCCGMVFTTIYKVIINQPVIEQMNFPEKKPVFDQRIRNQRVPDSYTFCNQKSIHQGLVMHKPVISQLNKSDSDLFKEVWRKRGFAKPTEILLSLFVKFPVADSRRIHSPFFNGLLWAGKWPQALVVHGTISNRCATDWLSLWWKKGFAKAVFPAIL